MLPVIIAGSSGHASVVIDALRLLGVPIAGLLDSALDPGSLRHGLPILGAFEDAAGCANREGSRTFFVAIGDNTKRARFTAALSAAVPGAGFATVIHPSASVAASARIGAGTLVCAQANVGPNSVLGEGVILNSGSSADHDCRLGNFSSLAPGVHLGGNVEIGEETAISIGAAVIHGRRIGARTVVGAGAVVLEDLPDGVMAYGLPAKVIRSREPGEPYL